MLIQVSLFNFKLGKTSLYLRIKNIKRKNLKKFGNREWNDVGIAIANNDQLCWLIVSQFYMISFHLKGVGFRIW